MIVADESNFDSLLELLGAEEKLAIDCEATGLRPYHGDRLFSIAVATETGEVYFNFQNYPGIYALDRREYCARFASWLLEAERVSMVYLFNAKYDMALLFNEGIEFPDDMVIHDVKSIERVCFNDLPPGSYSLDDCARRRGWAKDTGGGKQYCDEHGLFTREEFTGKKKCNKLYHFERVPFDRMSTYACKDTRLTFDIGELQLKHLAVEDASRQPGWPQIMAVYDNECELTPNVFRMEQIGVLIDTDYCRRAIEVLERTRQEKIIAWKAATDRDWKKSGKLFKEVFATDEDKWDKTKPSKITGNVGVSFDKDTVLPKFKNPAAQIAIEISEAKAEIDYYHGFLYHSDAEGRIHTSLNQDGTDTGRFSSSNPNLQNLKKPDGTEAADAILVRRAIVPDRGKFFVFMDFDQLQFRMMLDYANAKGIIKRIIEDGLDVHQATAEVAGITRQEGKTVNFSIIFGAGIKLLAKNLGVSELQARTIKESVFRAAPEIQDFIQQVMWKAEKRRFVFNWFGRRYDMPNPKLSYIAPNKTIQGGEADLVKVGINRIAKYCGTDGPQMVLQVHDELVFLAELRHIPMFAEIKRILESIFPHRHLPLTVGIKHSFKNMADKIKGLPDVS
jgi:DNA polymerase-1